MKPLVKVFQKPLSAANEGETADEGVSGSGEGEAAGEESESSEESEEEESEESA